MRVQRSRSSVAGVVFSWSVASCAARNEAPLGNPASAATSEGPSEPGPATGWAPDEPSYDADAGVAWLPVSVGVNCESAALPPVVTTEEAFRASTCLTSTVDWSRYRLAIYTGADLDADRALRVTGVRREADRVLVFVSASGPCHAYEGYSDERAAALLTASDQPVVFIRSESFMPECATPSDGYGY